MANIFTSSIGKKLIMSITGLFLILFLTLHLVVNSLSLISEEAFQAGCDFMALPIVTVMVPILAAGFIIHIIYAFYLSYTNLKARGKARYAVSNKGPADSWAAKNMLILGIIVLGCLALHFTDFWAEMQLKQFQGVPHEELANPNALLAETFGSYRITICYLLWFVALWFHLTHGFWSAFQTIGWNNNIWIKRLKVIGYIYSTLICVGFAAVAIVACLRANGILFC